MTIAPSASARAGEDPPELQRFIMKHSLSNSCVDFLCLFLSLTLL
jgi:hypothetical protein